MKPDELKNAFVKRTKSKKFKQITPYCSKTQVVWEISDKNLNEFLEELKKDKKNGEDLYKNQ